MNYIKREQGINLSVRGLFDVQIKRMHEYKRQFLNILSVVHRYINLKKLTDDERIAGIKNFFFFFYLVASYYKCDYRTNQVFQKLTFFMWKNKGKFIVFEKLDCNLLYCERHTHCHLLYFFISYRLNCQSYFSYISRAEIELKIFLILYYPSNYSNSLLTIPHTTILF
jgi:hypothetical protein